MINNGRTTFLKAHPTKYQTDNTFTLSTVATVLCAFTPNNNKLVKIMNDQQIENEIVAKGLTAPRVTPDYIESVISFEYYFTAGEGVLGASSMGRLPAGKADSLNQLTFCVLVLKNGFTVTGESACASSENFDADLGRKIARKNAFNKIWLLEGYLLKQRLSEQ